MPTGLTPFTEVAFNVSDPLISSDLDGLEFAFYDDECLNPAPYLSATVGPSFIRTPEPIHYAVVGKANHSFFDDMYYRVWSDPLEILLGTVATNQTRQINLWNAFPDEAAILGEILLTDPVGITIAGDALPRTLNPLEETSYEFEVDALGAPQIASNVLFDFINVPDPLPSLILGQRAVRFDMIPEAGVIETWEWLTDLLVASDGTEQRVSLRGGIPRTILDLTVKFDTRDKVAKFANDLITANNAFWIPEWQYSTPLTQPSLAGTTRLYFDPARTDVRPGEYVILITVDQDSFLVEIATLLSDGCTTNSILPINVDTRTFVSPGSVAVIREGTSLSRMPVDTWAETKLTCTFQRRRASLIRPGDESPSRLTIWNGAPVLDYQPLADDNTNEDVITNIEVQDNEIGEIKLYKLWAYPRVNISKQYLVSRHPITTCQDKFLTHIDFWRHFFNYVRGPQRKFWCSTWRKDFTVFGAVAPGANTLLLREKDYAEKVFDAMPTHRYLEIVTAGGTHWCTVQLALVDDAYSQIVFTPSLPLGAGWTDVQRISYLFPMRLESDSVDIEHQNTRSIISFTVRTAE